MAKSPLMVGYEEALKSPLVYDRFRHPDDHISYETGRLLKLENNFRINRVDKEPRISYDRKMKGNQNG